MKINDEITFNNNELSSNNFTNKLFQVISQIVGSFTFYTIYSWCCT